MLGRHEYEAELSVRNDDLHGLAPGHGVRLARVPEPLRLHVTNEGIGVTDAREVGKPARQAIDVEASAVSARQEPLFGGAHFRDDEPHDQRGHDRRDLATPARRH